MTTDELAVTFFEHWYCENGLPVELISDQDKLFTSKFWNALHGLTGVKLKMSTSYYPETDGASERTNKLVIQLIHYHVERQQTGWVKALLKIRFDIMNTVNASTGFSSFQLRLGHSPRIIPPLVPSNLPAEIRASEEAQNAQKLLEEISHNVAEAKDSMLAAKIRQTLTANAKRF
jgi:hypothetical protein